MTTTTAIPNNSDVSVLLVGHCNFDGPKLKTLATKAGATKVDGVATAHEAFEQILRRPYRAVLVNRIFDVDGGSGIDFIKEAAAQFPKIHFLLVSNLPEAQAAAEKVGASKGFGKDALHSPETAGLLKMSLAAPQ